MRLGTTPRAAGARAELHVNRNPEPELPRRVVGVRRAVLLPRLGGSAALAMLRRHHGRLHPIFLYYAAGDASPRNWRSKRKHSPRSPASWTSLT